MSKAKLKKYLQTLSKEQVIEVILELYDARKEAKDYLEFYLTPDNNAELEKCKKAIRQEFFPTRGFSEKYNPQIQIFAESETKRPFFECSFKTKRTKKDLRTTQTIKPEIRAKITLFRALSNTIQQAI